MSSKQNEKDPDGLGQHEMGAKLDANKPPVVKGFFKYFPRSIRACSWLSNTGAMKYEWGGWSCVAKAEDRYQEAEARHLLDLCEGEDYDLVYEDPDTGTKYYHHHLVSKAWNAMASLEKAITERKIVTEYTEDGTTPTTQ